MYYSLTLREQLSCCLYHTKLSKKITQQYINKFYIVAGRARRANNRILTKFQQFIWEVLVLHFTYDSYCKWEKERIHTNCVVCHRDKKNNYYLFTKKMGIKEVCSRKCGMIFILGII